MRTVTFDSIEFISKIKEIGVVEDDGSRHCNTLRPDRPSTRLMLLLHYFPILKNRDRLLTKLDATVNLSVAKYITRRPKQAMTLTITQSTWTQTFLFFNPNRIALDQCLSFLAFPLYSNVDSGCC